MYSYYVYYCILVVFCILGLKVLHGLINQSINQSLSLSLDRLSALCERLSVRTRCIGFQR